MSEQTPSGANLFSNDGSFMERFKQLQQKSKEEEKAAATTTPPLQSRLAGQKTVPFRLGAKRVSKPAPAPAAATAFGDTSDKEEDDVEEESGRGQPRPPTTKKG